MIEMKQLTKAYGDFTALDGLTLSIPAGTVFGFVGANGAGKSTTFSILATLLEPTSGDAWIDGHSVRTNPMAVRAAIGYMPDFFGVYDQLRVDEYLDFYGASYQLSANERAERIPYLLQLVRLTDKRYEYVDFLSRGMKQRLCLARALIHDPKVLILDEPASGLDPRARSEMKEIVRQLKEQGKTIVISSHILPELAEMCDEIGVLDKGTCIAKGPVAAIEGQLKGERTLTVKVSENKEEALAFLETHPFISMAKLEQDESITVSFGGNHAQQAVLVQQAVLAGIAIYELVEQKQDLEDAYLAIVEGVTAHDGEIS